MLQKGADEMARVKQRQEDKVSKPAASARSNKPNKRDAEVLINTSRYCFMYKSYKVVVA